MTYIPISIVISNNSSWIKVQILQVEVSFDIIGKVFVGSFTEIKQDDIGKSTQFYRNRF